MIPALKVMANAQHQSQHGPQYPLGRCLEATRNAFGVPSDGTPTAIKAWERARHKHRTTDFLAIPKAAPVFWSGAGGSNGFGHVAIGAGAGRCWSTDILRPGFFDLTLIGNIAKQWPGHTLLGWTEDIDSAIVWEAHVVATEKNPHFDQVVKAMTEATKAKKTTPQRVAIAQAVLAIVKPYATGGSAK